MKKITVLAAVLVAVVAVAACGSSDSGVKTESEKEAEPTAEGIDVEVADAWVAAPIGNATVTGAFMDVKNTGGDAVKLVAASVDPVIAADTQLHETTTAEGDMSGGDTNTTMADIHGRDTTTTMGGMHGGEAGDTAGMKEVESIDIPAGETVSLKRGSYHVMLIDLAAPLQVGETVPITLTFEDEAGETKEVRVEAEVKAT
ncbi:MAG: copper chaperone PCu(A)C [Acidimicrobiia bacterium]|nr:copper chaperone PCu(A)C [Acidimicrobiia bacterium]